jgi:arginyl-tRNA synthetase
MNIQEKIKKWIEETLKLEKEITLLHPKDIKNGDYSFFVGDKASEYVEALRQAQGKILEILKIELAGKFINFYLSKDFFAEAVSEINKKGDKCGENDLYKNKKILVDHTQPNPFKLFHIGHLMNNAIGESITRILRANGAEVWAVGYHGDVGMHVAKAIWGKMQKPELSWGEAYAFGAKSFEENKEEITALNTKISEKSDEKINKLYEEGRESSLNFFEDLYKELGSKFDHHFYESEVGEIGKEIVLQNVPKIFEESEGAIIFRGENYEPKTHTRVFINSQGLPVYEAKEIGLAKLKKEKYDYDQSITVTASEQDSFFNVAEVAIGEIFPELKGKLTHISHGMLKLPTGKMSSRTGDVITGEALIEQVKEKVLEKIADRDFDEKIKEEIAEIVAIGAIKYSILRQAIGGDIIFDFDKSISFEGDSGPYLQYTAVRANSVLAKANFQFSIFNFQKIFNLSIFKKIKRPKNFEITELERYLYRFAEVVERAGKEYAPHYIVTYLTELASIFNSFYANNRIIDSTPALSEQSESNGSSYKLALTSAVSHILTSGLNLLGIKVPPKM